MINECMVTINPSGHATQILTLTYDMYINSSVMYIGLTALNSRGVWNPMKISDTGIGFLKTEQNRPQNSKPNTRFPRFGFQKTTSVVGDGFSVFHSQFILQHDRINRHSIFLHATSLHF